MLATIIISVLLMGLISLIIVNLIKKKKQGKNSCGGGCNGCGMSNMCHK